MVNDEEQLSALMDEEVPAGEIGRILDGLSRDSERRMRWGRYQLVSDALRYHLPEQIPLDFARRVSRALEDEPVVLAPPRRISRLHQFTKPAIGIAVAASVTVVAILAVRSTTVMEPELPAVAANEQAQMTLAADPLTESRLNPYLVNHTEYAITGGMQGMLPYVRVVSQEAAR